MTTTLNTTGWTKLRADDQQTWDDYPHTVWDAVPVTELALYDVLAQCLQIEGIAAAEHRGKPAVRLDVNNVAAGGKGRTVLTVEQVVSCVKRYEGDAVDTAGAILARASAAREALLKRSVRTTEATTYDFAAAALAWTKADSDPDLYDDDEQRLFAFLCAGVEAYSRLVAGDGDKSDGDFVQEVCGTLQSIGENLQSLASEAKGW